MSAERARPAPAQLLAGIRCGELEALPPERRLELSAQHVARAAAALLAGGARFSGIFAVGTTAPIVHVLLALRGELVVLVAPLGGGRSYPALAQVTDAAAFAERELHDETGIAPLGHPSLEPILRPDADELQRRVVGAGTFAIPYGPIRSGVFEAIQYPIDTGGEDVLTVTVRPFFKRRDVEARLRGLPLDRAADVVERLAGPAAVAHAVAFAHACERALDVPVPPRAARWRVVHAELERIANHLDVATKLAEDAALAVGAARFGALKEQTMRLRAQLCGSRFGRGAVRPGGIADLPFLSPTEVIRAIDGLERDLLRDRALLLRTPSFTDRLIGAGTLDGATVDRFGGVGPIARACGLGIDTRLERPYGAYARLGFRIATGASGDAMARLEVRFDELDQSLHLIRQALERFDRLPPHLRGPVDPGSGESFGWAEAPAGELLYRVAIEGGAVGSVNVVSPSFRNWPLFAESFRGDVLTDFSFIEHSFGLTAAGADR